MEENLRYKVHKNWIDIGDQEHWGLTVLGSDGCLYFKTESVPESIFKDRARANAAIKKSKQKWPGVEFKIEEGEFFIPDELAV